MTKVTTNKISITKPAIKHSINNFYYDITRDAVNILCQVDYKKVCLVSLNNANRHNNPVEVVDINNITDSEFDVICSTSTQNFKLLSSVDIAASI